MAKQLRDYKRKEIRCLIVEDFETGVVRKVSDREEIKECLKKHTENEITKIYNPTREQIAEIEKIIKRSNENEMVYAKIEGLDMLIRVVPMLTDIKVDLDVEEDIELINEIILDPDAVINAVVLEINRITMAISLEWIEGLKVLNELPDDVVKALAKENLNA